MILLGGIDALARANQRDVSHLKFTDDDREMGQTPAQAIKPD
jgi:hypothetical protein